MHRVKNVSKIPYSASEKKILEDSLISFIKIVIYDRNCILIN